MTELEKLIELINNGIDGYRTAPIINGLKDSLAEYLADHLLANGAIVPIPRKPIANLEKDYEGNVFDVVYSCPSCNRGICYEAEGNLAKSYPYCNCGQKLDWGDTE